MLFPPSPSPNKTPNLPLQARLSNLKLIHYVPIGIRCTRLLYQFNRLIGWSSSQSFGAAILCVCWVRDLTDEDQPVCVRDHCECTVVTCIWGLLWAIPDITHTSHNFNNSYLRLDLSRRPLTKSI